MSGLDPATTTVVATLIVTNFGAIVAGYVSIRVAIAELKLKAERTEKDLDNIAKLIGTNRAIGEEKQKKGDHNASVSGTSEK